MKKLFVLTCLMLLSLTAVNATEQPKIDAKMQQKIIAARAQRENAFEKRLELTEVQKLKAREIRKNGHEKLKPVLDEIKSKKQEAEMVRRSRMAVQMQEEKLAVIDAELKVLEKKANSIRKSNMKDFESILTRHQKQILKNMKKEGRQRYHSQHPVKYPHKPMPQGFVKPINK